MQMKMKCFVAHTYMNNATKTKNCLTRCLFAYTQLIYINWCLSLTSKNLLTVLTSEGKMAWEKCTNAENWKILIKRDFIEKRRHTWARSYREVSSMIMNFTFFCTDCTPQTAALICSLLYKPYKWFQVLQITFYGLYFIIYYDDGAHIAHTYIYCVNKKILHYLH